MASEAHEARSLPEKPFVFLARLFQSASLRDVVVSLT